MAFGSFTVNGGSAHLYLSDSGHLSGSVFSAFSSFLDEQGTFSKGAFSGSGSAAITFYDTADSGSVTFSGTDTISAGVLTGTTFKITPSTGTSPSTQTFSAGTGNASLFGGSALHAEFSKVASAVPAPGNASLGADTLAAAMGTTAASLHLVPAPNTITLADSSKITFLQKLDHKG